MTHVRVMPALGGRTQARCTGYKRRGHKAEWVCKAPGTNKWFCRTCLEDFEIEQERERDARIKA